MFYPCFIQTKLESENFQNVFSLMLVGMNIILMHVSCLIYRNVNLIIIRLLFALFQVIPLKMLFNVHQQ